jgi:aminobenzoyl-glutamate utilization protein B
MYLCILDKNGVTGKNPTGGGIAGENWILPLCDYEPPIHLRSPEYVTTGRGEEWWIPAMPD